MLTCTDRAKSDCAGTFAVRYPKGHKRTGFVQRADIARQVTDMTTFGKGLRAGTRRKLASAKRKKFKAEPFLQEFRTGQSVVIKHDPSSHKGMPHTRYRGMVGIVKARRGSAYLLGLKMGKKEKELIARPEHLKAIKQ